MQICLRVESIVQGRCQDYFNEESQGHLVKRDAGQSIHISEAHYHKFAAGLGYVSNNQDELLALKYTLLAIINLGIQEIQIFGDSLLVIKWMKKRNPRNIYLLTIYEDMVKVAYRFQFISFYHIYYEINEHVDQVSKMVYDRLKACGGSGSTTMTT